MADWDTLVAGGFADHLGWVLVDRTMRLAELKPVYYFEFHPIRIRRSAMNTAEGAIYPGKGDVSRRESSTAPVRAMPSKGG